MKFALMSLLLMFALAACSSSRNPLDPSQAPGTPLDFKRPTAVPAATPEAETVSWSVPVLPSDSFDTPSFAPSPTPTPFAAPSYPKKIMRVRIWQGSRPSAFTQVVTGTRCPAGSASTIAVVARGITDEQGFVDLEVPAIAQTLLMQAMTPLVRSCVIAFRFPGEDLGRIGGPIMNISPSYAVGVCSYRGYLRY